MRDLEVWRRVEWIVHRPFDLARSILADNHAVLEAVADELAVRRSMSGEAVAGMVGRVLLARRA